VYADLHLHSAFSDGTYTPEEVATEGLRHGFSTLALTDHDTIEGCERMAAACRGYGIEFVTGVELTAECQEQELHVLGYYLDAGDPRLLERLTQFQEVRQNRIREMVARLNGMSIPLAAEAVFALASCRSPGRPHVARALVHQGYCANLDEAFERFLKKNRPAWVPKFKMSATAAIELIHGAGGLAVMAHPGLNHADHLVPDLVAAGLDGLECFHTKHSAATSQHYVQMAARYGLLATGGSDCHGQSKGKPLIGTVKLPHSYIEAMQDRARQRRAANQPAAGVSLDGA